VRASLIPVVLGLAACGGGTPASPLPNTDGAVHADRRASWMLPGAKSAKRLLYVGDWSTNDVYVYGYPGGKQVGQLTGFDEPYGMCVDAKGDIYVANFGEGNAVEYAHGGTNVLNTYDSGGSPIGCAVYKNGDLAVTSFDPGEVTVYAGGDSNKGTTYSDSSCDYLWTMGYDDKGDLVGEGESSSIAVCALLVGSKTMQTLSWSGKLAIDFPGGTTWDGKYLAIGGSEGFEGAIIQAKLKGLTLIKVGETGLANNCYSDYVDIVNPLIVGKTNGLWAHKQGNTVVDPNLWCYESGASGVDFWHYPAGGSPFKTLPSAPREPYGAGVSLAQ
jgi:hypothetical protein